MSILHALKIEAEPVLASSQLGDLLPTRLPSAVAFDHILVRATVGSDSLWLDGTAGGTRLADIRDVPPFRHVLPVRAAGPGLIDVPLRARAARGVDRARSRPVGGNRDADAVHRLGHAARRAG